MKIDCVFSGGGVKAYAFLGALESIEQKELSIQRTAGTSAGSILAAFLAAGYTSTEIRKLMDSLDLSLFLDPPKLTTLIPGSKWFFLYFQMGIYKGNRFENWLHTQLANKNVHTFSDLKEQALRVVVSDLTLGKLVVIPDDLKDIYGIDPAHFPVSKAVRMSAGFPYFFMPKKMPGKVNMKSIIVDGGLLSNFPLWLFKNDKGDMKRPVLGVQLSESIELQKPRKISNAQNMLHALFSTMKQAHDTRYISKSNEDNIIFIPVKSIHATDFNIDDATKQSLIVQGKSSAAVFLKHWPNGN
ncbi:patatin-like phospholipase family protein [Ornithinibacillus gellani]|uniref:patatin-like phospholipase family protein n=1 Tax=Ornithinibacillus gellani TaxID=2293253 RepID=UPI000F482B0B|nr:patatin-like phospholipase family protein [Ornithinibacillus gellani]TQS74526.1 patatin-like phospholipase family protein [Ornithinibacillus gellani]